MEGWTRKQKGDFAELKAIEFLFREGYTVYKPVFENGTTDLIADKDGKLHRVSVKFTSERSKSGQRYVVQLRNMSPRLDGSLVIKYFDASSVDLLLAYIGPEDRIVAVEASTIEARSTLTIS